MHICRRKFGALALGGLAAKAFALPTRSRLFVLLVLEQFRPDYLATGWTPLTGGLRKVLDKGAYFPDCRHAASTFSASAIATLATGAWPAEHGIVADSWYDRSSRKLIPASDESLLATTLAAQIVASPFPLTIAQPRFRVYVISDSASHAGLFAGTPEARVVWMDGGGQFASRGEGLDWLAAFNGSNSPDRFHGAEWLPAGAKPGSPALRTLTYDQNHPMDFVALYKSSPFGQAAQFDLLNECLSRERLGQTDSFDFVCIISGAMARLGYEKGARDPLMQDMVAQLDRSLDSFLVQAARATGDAGFNFAFVGAHGSPPQPSAETRARKAVNGEAVAQAIDRALASNGMGSVEKYVYPFLYLDSSGWRDPEPIRLAAARAALDHSAIAGYYTAGGACSTQDEWIRRYRNSFHSKRSGDVMLSYRPEYVEDYEPHRGISYGSLYDYDVRVPLCFYGPQFRAEVFESPVEAVDLAPTLARALGVATPSSAAGRVLGEAFAE